MDDLKRAPRVFSPEKQKRHRSASNSVEKRDYYNAGLNNYMDANITEIAKLIGIKRKYEDRVFVKLKEAESLRKDIHIGKMKMNELQMNAGNEL